MKPIAVVAGSFRRGQCRSCRAPIEWAEAAGSGKRIPFNIPIALAPSLAFDDGDRVLWVDMTKTTSHFATCPAAAQYRRPR